VEEELVVILAQHLQEQVVEVLVDIELQDLVQALYKELL
jgi:hypothetical protein